MACVARGAGLHGPIGLYSSAATASNSVSYDPRDRSSMLAGTWIWRYSGLGSCRALSPRGVGLGARAIQGEI